MTKYRILEKDEIIQEGDELDACVDGWRDNPIWTTVPRAVIGLTEPDPRYPGHTLYRRPVTKDATKK